MTSLWKKLMDEYTTYNQYVDIVSCWESAVNNVFQKERKLNFYRFPSTHQTINGKKYKPDFSVRVNKDYGILFELKRTIGGGDQGIERASKQIANYLDDIDLDSLNEKFPKNKDVVLIVRDIDSRSIAKNLRKNLSEKNIDDSNLIILEYSDTPSDSIFSYTFRKVYPESSNFSNEFFKKENPLNQLFGDDNDFRGMKIPTKYFWSFRNKCPIMNDDPPPVYLTCLLWTDIFYDMLSNQQKRSIKRSIKYVPIEIEMKSLIKKVKKFFPVSSDDIKKCMEFLVDGNLAEESDKTNVDYVLKYHRLKKDKVFHTKQQNEGNRREFIDIAEKFITRYCKYKENGPDCKEIKIDTNMKSTSLDDF